MLQNISMCDTRAEQGATLILQLSSLIRGIVGLTIQKENPFLESNLPKLCATPAFR